MCLSVACEVRRQISKNPRPLLVGDEPFSWCWALLFFARLLAVGFVALLLLTVVFAVLLTTFCADFIAKLLKALRQFLHRCLVGIVGDNHGMGLDICFEVFYAFLKGDVLHDLGLAVGTDHLGDVKLDGLDVFGAQADGAQAKRKQKGGNAFHDVCDFSDCLPAKVRNNFELAKSRVLILLRGGRKVAE